MVWQQGTFLMTRFFNGLAINLYYVDNFYVEVWYNREENYIQQITSFKSLECLEPYLSLIDLNLND